MSTSRPESQHPPQSGRKRSNTVQSHYKHAPPVTALAPPLKQGDFKLLITWVHDMKDSPSVVLNQSHWPGVSEGDIIQISAHVPGVITSGLLFIVPKDEVVKHQLQISVPRPMAEKLNLRNNGEVVLTKVDKDEWSADFVEFTFQDQYLGRNEMWRLDQYLVGQCVFVDQEISFVGTAVVNVHAIYIAGKKTSTAYVTSRTKMVYRSLSAKATLFIQVCRELWEFAGDGERYNEKIVHSFLPALFAKWREAGTTHIVTIVLISRVFYDQSEVDYAAGPLRRDEDGRWYKDFFKVITDLEVVYDWKPTLITLKDSFWAFQRDILLTHHYHRAGLFAPLETPDNVRLVGRLSYAHDGPVLEALNLSFNPMETHYIDRSLSLTGSATIIITPGTGYYRVSKQLLRLTTTRILDQGFAIELVSLNKPPLHQSPIFSFTGTEPVQRPEGVVRPSSLRLMDTLWGDDDEHGEKNDRKRGKFWWEPFWMSVSFWDKQMDLPFRQDRFVARAKMHEIEMLGLLDHDVLSGIELPFLPEHDSFLESSSASDSHARKPRPITQAEADKFDLDIFSDFQTEPLKPQSSTQNSLTSSAGSLRSGIEALKRSFSTRTAESLTQRIPHIEDAPRRIVSHLPAVEDVPPAASGSNQRQALTEQSGAPSTSPSQSSMRSGRSNVSTSSKTGSTTVVGESSRSSSVTRPLLKGATKFTPTWFWNTFSRSGPSLPETSAVSAEGLTNPKSFESPSSSAPISTGKTIPAASKELPVERTPKPMFISNAAVRARTAGTGRNLDEEILFTHRGSVNRNSPLNTPPREGMEAALGGKRRSGNHSSYMSMIGSSSSPVLRTNPLRPLAAVPSNLAYLASRWQHMFPEPLSKHDIKWKAMVSPGCLPLTVEYFPNSTTLDTKYDLFPYDFVVDPPEMRSFLVRPPTVHSHHPEAIRRSWALVVMRVMVALRLAQGFQLVVRSGKPQNLASETNSPSTTLRRTSSYIVPDDLTPRPAGAPEVLQSPDDPVYLSMSNEMHRIAYSGDTIQVRRYVRRMPRTRPFDYQCLIWPKTGVGYTELKTSFVPHGLEGYGWNRLDMLVAGYESQFNDALRYWRTRFVVIPTYEPPMTTTGPLGEKLDDEEIRLLGMEKLAEQFSKVRWVSSEEKAKQHAPVRFIFTDLGPTQCVLDETIIAQLDDIHAAGPLKKKVRSEKDIAETSLAALAKAMRDDDGVLMKDRRWHGRTYSNAFTGSDLVSWLVREFRDVPTREQATEWGSKLQDQGLFEHCRGAHGFLDGHYFYALRGEYLVPMTPRGGWFRSTKHVIGEENLLRSGGQTRSPMTKRTRKKLILSQSMVIDVDLNKKSSQAETVMLHHDIIHNASTCFHFELQWIGTTARCIDDILRQWNRAIEKYGLRLVEAYVTQISDIRDRNPFQSCFPIPLALEPPTVHDLQSTVNEGTQVAHYFESALLRKLGYVLDIEGRSSYPDRVEVVYSYRRAPFKYSQWVHRSGVAFVQVLGGTDGFLFLTNRLLAPGKFGPASKQQRSGAAAEEVRKQLQQACSDVEGLSQFYRDELAGLDIGLEEPPPLLI
ncbi:hypothetical protein BC835DRAFT_1420375 [Cytidiella melzeri]|nr:hypothetical protein BC835DRAFT_1420375 [Cytidiella melzeri]